jgi:HK97 family phage major capsid protein
MSDRLSFASVLSVDGRRIKGSVQLAGSRTLRNGEWVEVDPAALMKANRKNAFASMEHDDSKILGAFGNKTLDIRFTDQGFEYETADLPNTSYANDALELVGKGYVTGSSFEIDGLRSAFSTDPDGTRVRRYVGIKTLLSVSPVRDPAFPSLAAAFDRKGHEMTDPIEQPAPEPEPTPEPPKVTFAAPAVNDTYKTAEAFARRQTPEQLEQAMDNILAGGLEKGGAQETYDAFAKVFDERAASDAKAKQSRDAIALAHLMRTGRGPKAPESRELFESEDYKQAFSAYLRTGDKQTMQQFAQTISGSGVEGGFTVPDGFVAKLTERLKTFGGIAAAADEITTSTGESLRWPYIDDTANKAQIVAEDTQATTGADLAFDSIELGAFEYDATGASGNPIEVSLPLLQDSAFDIEALLLRLLGTRIGRKQADSWATGGGGTEPVGLLTKALDTMTASATSLAAPEHILQVDAAYRDNGNTSWIMSDTSLAKVWTAQSTTNQPLFLPGGTTINGKPFNTLYGSPIRIDPAAGNLVAFGDIAAGYIIRRVRGVQLLVDPYSAQKKRAVQYHAWARADGNIQDPNAYSVSDWSGVSADT